MSTLFIKTPKKFRNIKHFWVVLISFEGHKVMKDIFGIFYKHYL